MRSNTLWNSLSVSFMTLSLVKQVTFRRPWARVFEGAAHDHDVHARVPGGDEGRVGRAGTDIGVAVAAEIDAFADADRLEGKPSAGGHQDPEAGQHDLGPDAVP